MNVYEIFKRLKLRNFTNILSLKFVKFSILWDNFKNILFNVIIRSQLWVAVCLTLLCAFFQFVNDWQASEILILSFFATLFSYNLAHWVTRKIEKWRLAIMMISTIICIYIAFSFLGNLTLFVLIILGLISTLYSVVIFKTNLRNLPFLKIFWIAMVWAMTIILPVFEQVHTFGYAIVMQSISIFCFVVAITIPFDIRDMQLDAPSLKTIPQHMGIEKSIYSGYGLLFLSFIFFYIGNKGNWDNFTLAFLLSLLFAGFALYKSKNSQGKYFTSFWVEGLSALPYIIYLML